MGPPSDGPILYSQTASGTQAGGWGGSKRKKKKKKQLVTFRDQRAHFGGLLPLLADQLTTD